MITTITPGGDYSLTYQVMYETSVISTHAPPYEPKHLSRNQETIYFGVRITPYHQKLK